jgi:hypothetical protein
MTFLGAHTAVYAAISLVAIAAGVAVVSGFSGSRSTERATRAYLAPFAVVGVV